MDYNSSDITAFMVLAFYGLIFIAKPFLFGFMCQHIIKGKGYEKNWFWWGFFFGIIALIVALAYPRAPIDEYQMYGNGPMIHEEWYRKQEQERYAAQMRQYQMQNNGQYQMQNNGQYQMQSNEQYQMQYYEQNKIQYDEQHKESEVNR